CQQGYTSPFSF
nr:immunoglobulin light chain junction region [Macaca mulatta]